MLRFVHRARTLPRLPEYGHLLQDALYPGSKPSAAAEKKASELAAQSQRQSDVDAIVTLSQAILLNPPDPGLYLLRARSRLKLKMWVEALDDAELCVSLDMANAAGWLLKGDAECALSRTTDAVMSYEAGLQAQPGHGELQAALTAALAEPTPGLWHQLRDLLFAAQLGLEKFFHTVDEPEKATEAFVEANSSILDTQLILLAQTLRVNTVVLLDSSMLCDAYEQIVYACSHLVSGAPAAFSNQLSRAPDIIEGLALALRVGWHVHNTVPKVAANALVALATSPHANDALRRLAVRHLLAGMHRWLLDARPEPDRDGDEVGGCNCSVPWRAAACFLERLLSDEPFRTPSWVKEECEAWPEIASLCLWLTLSVRDFHATPLSLAALLQLPRVAAAVMQSDAMVDFFVVSPHMSPIDLSTAVRLGDGGLAPLPSSAESLASSSDAAIPLETFAPLLSTSLGQYQVRTRENEEDLMLPPEQRLCEWLMASLGYLLLFIEDDALFTVSACRAIQTMAVNEPDGATRLLSGLWLGVPLLNKLSLYACSHTPALDLLHFLVGSGHRGVVVAARSLAHTLAGQTPAARLLGHEAHTVALDTDAQDDAVSSVNTLGDFSFPEEQLPQVIEAVLEEETAPSWAEFYHELLNELASPPDHANSPPELVTLLNFEEKASMLTEQALLSLLEGDGNKFDCIAVPSAWNRRLDFVVPSGAREKLEEMRLFVPSDGGVESDLGSEPYLNDPAKKGSIVLMSRRSIRQSAFVENWAQAVHAAETAGAVAVVVFNDLDGMAPFRMGLFGERSPGIPAFMVSGKDGHRCIDAFNRCEHCSVGIESFPSVDEQQAKSSETPPPWPLASARPQVDVAQAWSLFETLSHHVAVHGELDSLLSRMSVPEKRVWLTRRLVRHHYGQHMVDAGLAEMPLAFVECDRHLPPAGHLTAIRRQLCEGVGLGADELWGDFEVRFKDEAGVGSAVLREWIDMVAREAFLSPSNHLLRSYDRGQSFLPDPAALFCNPQWEMDYEALGRLLGLSLWHSCTLDLPLHHHFCTLLFHGREAAAEVRLADVDADTAKLKVDWLLNNPIAELGFELPFTDCLGNDSAQLSAKQTPELGASTLELGGGGDVDEHRGGSKSSSERSSSWGGTPMVDKSASGPSMATLLRGHRHAAGTALEASIFQQASPSSSSTAAAPLPAFVRFEDRLQGNTYGWPGAPLREVGNSEILLGAFDGPDVVTDDNKGHFAESLRCWRTRQGIELQVAAVRRGISTVIPHQVLQEMQTLMSPMECAQLLSGLREIDVDDWERHSVCSTGMSRSSEQVKWFWNTVRRWAAAPEERIRLPQLLQFVTGSARVPVGGFRELVGFNGAKHPFTLSRGLHLTATSLPQAHACICTLDLPPYADEATCASKLAQMLSLGREHFDEAAGHTEDG